MKFALPLAFLLCLFSFAFADDYDIIVQEEQKKEEQTKRQTEIKMKELENSKRSKTKAKIFDNLVDILEEEAKKSGIEITKSIAKHLFDADGNLLGKLSLNIFAQALKAALPDIKKELLKFINNIVKNFLKEHNIATSLALLIIPPDTPSFIKDLILLVAKLLDKVIKNLANDLLK